jgi:hypothetical protein
VILIKKLCDIPEVVAMKDEFRALSSRYHAQKGERFEIQKPKVGKDESVRKSIYYCLNSLGPYDSLIEPGKYVQLYDRNLEEVIMTNSSMEFYTNYDFISKARGDILVGGLGLGLLELSIQDKPEVNSITVVEYYPEIIEMILSQLKFRGSISVINEDILNFKTEKKFDTAYFDIWSTVSMQNYPGMKDLRMKFSGSLKDSSSWIGCWREEECKMLYEYTK